MRFLGVDLAWGERSATGLAAIDADGTVIASARRISFDHIVAWCAEQSMGDVIIAVDAPVVVVNPTGRRGCEQIISTCYGGRNASAHSSNTSMKPFALGTRAARLAAALAVEVDPVIDRGAAVRRLIEVYPHPAIVTLFGLTASLPYKSKHRRTVQTRRLAIEQLLSLVEGLAAADPPMNVSPYPGWQAIRRTIAEASSDAAMDGVEDELDAYVCAYIGLFYWRHGLAQCRIVGDVLRGYIVTPVSPADGLTIDALSRLHEVTL